MIRTYRWDHLLRASFGVRNVFLQRKKHTRIGCASGFWGDSPSAVTQLVQHGNIDFIMMDYLSEVTMSLLTAAKAAKPDLGYTPDFISHALGPNLKDIKQKGIKIISNSGGINPIGCALALRKLCNDMGLDLQVATVTGDDLMTNKEKYLGIKDMKTQVKLPSSVHSMNAYLGAGPIAQCLDNGADIVITGRCADSALALGPLIHSVHKCNQQMAQTIGSFDSRMRHPNETEDQMSLQQTLAKAHIAPNHTIPPIPTTIMGRPEYLQWKWDDYDKLACGSLAGHLIECGAQVTGGIFTDWQDSSNWQNIGYPIADVSGDGSIVITKNDGTGGIVSQGTVSEQILYEIGDPRSYILPDVVCDFSKVQLEDATNGVRVFGAIGKPPTDSYKVSGTFMDGYKATAVAVIGGRNSIEKGRKTANAIIERSRRLFKEKKMPDFLRVNMQIIGAEDLFGPNAKKMSPRDAVIWISVHHRDKKALQLFGMEIASSATSMAPGLCSLIGGRPKPTPLLRLHSFLVPKDELKILTQIGNGPQEIFTPANGIITKPAHAYEYSDIPTSKSHKLKSGTFSYRLEDLAYARSGDKGDSCNIGVIARKPSYLPYIQNALTSQSVADYFKHLFPDDLSPERYVKRYELEGLNALNFVLEESLGGGGIASLRTDPQGKAYAQMLLDFPMNNMPDINCL